MNFVSGNDVTQNHSYYQHPGNHLDKPSLIYILVPSLGKYIIWDQIPFEITSTLIFLFQRIETSYGNMIFL